MAERTRDTSNVSASALEQCSAYLSDKVAEPCEVTEGRSITSVAVVAGNLRSSVTPNPGGPKG